MFRLLFLFLLISFSVAGQKLLEGKVVDQETGNPVPFASIGVVGSSRGTSTNINGEFSISLSEHVTLKVSCIGYESKTIESSSGITIIRLKPTATQLSAVIVLDKAVNARRVLQKAFIKRRRNTNRNTFVQKFFYRHYCKDDEAYGRLIEAYVDVLKKSGYRPERSVAGAKEEIRITQLRRSLDKTKLSQGHEPISIGNILQADLIGYQAAEKSPHMAFYEEVSNLRTDFEDYEVSFKGVTYYDGQEVYKIEYAYKEDSVLTTTGNYFHLTKSHGELYITTDDFAIIKSDDSKSYENSSVRTVAYYHKNGDYYYPYHLVRDGKSIGTDSKHEFHIELMSVEIDENPKEKFIGRLPNREELLHIPYDSNFWASNTILKTTPLEDGIIDDLGGGVSLNKQFMLYHQYELNIHDGGKNAEEKFNWLLKEGKGNKPLYLVFWAPDFQPYLAELELAKRLHKQYSDQVIFVFLSMDDNEENWKKTVSRFNFSTDGLINYRIGSHSQVSKMFSLKNAPAFILIDQRGNIFDKDARRPSDPQLLQEFNQLLHQ